MRMLPATALALLLMGCGGKSAVSVSASSSGPIASACASSPRQSTNAGLCGCIQKVADQTLRGGDQRRAAQFFQDPERAHEVWMSSSASDDSFWERYKNFGAVAEASCIPA
jgi:hypothetical protein